MELFLTAWTSVGTEDVQHDVGIDGVDQEAHGDTEWLDREPSTKVADVPFIATPSPYLKAPYNLLAMRNYPHSFTKTRILSHQLSWA